MSGSGIDGLLELVYAMNSVGNMMSGKPFARAIRGHFLLDSYLNNILIDKIVKEEKNPEGLENIDYLKWLCNNCTERAVHLSESKKRSANATTWYNEKLVKEKQIDRDIKNSTIMGSVYGICEGDTDVYLC